MGCGLQSLRGECWNTRLEGVGSRSKLLCPDVLIHVPAGDLSAQSAMTSEFTGSPNCGISWAGRGPEGILSPALGPAQEISKNHHIPENIVQDLRGAVQDPCEKDLSSGSFHPLKSSSSSPWCQQSIQMVLVWNVSYFSCGRIRTQSKIPFQLRTEGTGCSCSEQVTNSVKRLRQADSPNPGVSAHHQFQFPTAIACNDH